MSVSLAALAGLTLLLTPQERLACTEPWLEMMSPDSTWTLQVCRRPMLFGMPGRSGDTSGWIVLRESKAAIRGVVHLDMMQLLSEPHGDTIGQSGQSGQVLLLGLTALPLAPAAGPVSSWLTDRLWRLRALTGLVPSDAISAQWAR